MTRDQVDRTLMMMETCRQLHYDAETQSERRRFLREYNAMWKSIKPYVDGKIPYSTDTTP